MPERSQTGAVRLARPEDANQVVGIMSAVYREGRAFVGDGPPPALSLARRIADHDPREALYAVAVADATVGGWLELHRLQPQRLRHVAVLTVAVAADLRRRGLGRSLLRRSYAWAREVGVAKISLNVREGNGAAIALYRDEGFVEEGRERDHVLCDDGRFEDNLIMARWA